MPKFQVKPSNKHSFIPSFVNILTYFFPRFSLLLLLLLLLLYVCLFSFSLVHLVSLGKERVGKIST